MIIIKVELHSAVTGEVTQIAEGKIWNNEAGDDVIAYYEAEFSAQPWPPQPRSIAASRVSNVLHKRSDHVWELIERALSKAFP